MDSPQHLVNWMPTCGPGSKHLQEPPPPPPAGMVLGPVQWGQKGETPAVELGPTTPNSRSTPTKAFPWAHHFKLQQEAIRKNN